MNTNKTRSLLLCLAVYLAALLIAFLCVRVMRDGHLLYAALIADVAATVAVFTCSMLLDNSSLYDPYWSVAPPLIAVYWLTARGNTDAVSTRSLITGALLLLWAFRLTYNWSRQWRGLGHEDWRYRAFRERFTSLYWPVSFLGIHLLPTLIVFLGCLPLYSVMAPGASAVRPLGLLDLAAAAVTITAILIEALADRQLHAFKRKSGESGRILNSGLWARCRHPNYLGEMLFWWGLFLFGLAADPAHWWFILGPLAVSTLFLGISVPMMDRHLMQRKSGYAEHVEQVPALIPRLFRR